MISTSHLENKWQNAEHVKLREGFHPVQFESAYKSWIKTDTWVFNPGAPYGV